MIKSVSEVFKEQFWRELTVRHAAHDKKPSEEVFYASINKGNIKGAEKKKKKK